MAEAHHSDTTEWCAGMPLVRQRPLAEAERVLLQMEAQRLRRVGAGMLAVWPAVVAVSAAGFVLAASLSALTEAILAVGIMALVLVLLPLQALLARDAFRRSAGLGRDLRAGYVKLYAGKIRARFRTDETLARLRRAQLLPPEDDAELSIEVLPASGRVWRVVGEPVERWIVARSAQVAETPPFASMAAQWLEPVGMLDGVQMLGGQREMSAPELNEVRRCARRLRFRLLPFALGFTLWLGVPVAALVRQGEPPGRADWVRFAFLAFAALWTDAQWLRAAYIARRLERDARAARLVILRAERPRAGEEEAEEGEAPANAGGIVPVKGAPQIVEVLPVSRWVWTEDGRPAAWRIVSA